jgi:hypothetical protein
MHFLQIQPGSFIDRGTGLGKKNDAQFILPYFVHQE